MKEGNLLILFCFFWIILVSSSCSLSHQRYSRGWHYVNKSAVSNMDQEVSSNKKEKEISKEILIAENDIDLQEDSSAHTWAEELVDSRPYEYFRQRKQVILSNDFHSVPTIKEVTKQELQKTRIELGGRDFILKMWIFGALFLIIGIIIITFQQSSYNDNSGLSYVFFVLLGMSLIVGGSLMILLGLIALLISGW